MCLPRLLIVYSSTAPTQHPSETWMARRMQIHVATKSSFMAQPCRRISIPSISRTAMELRVHPCLHVFRRAGNDEASSLVEPLFRRDIQYCTSRDLETDTFSAYKGGFQKIEGTPKRLHAFGAFIRIKLVEIEITKSFNFSSLPVLLYCKDILGRWDGSGSPVP